MADWRVHADGTFDVVTRQGELRGAWPGVDHRPVRALSVEVVRGEAPRVTYRLAGGVSVELGFGRRPGGDLVLSCVVRGRGEAPHWVQPVCDAEVVGFTRLFRQGEGFSGPTGWVALDRTTHRGAASWSAGSAGSPWVLDSHLLAGFGGAEGVVVAGPLSHRDYAWKAEVYNRPVRGNFRNREVQENRVLAEFGFRTECVPVPGGELELPEVVIREGEAGYATLRAHAVDVAREQGVERVRPPTYHYCSWYHKVWHYSLEDLREVCRGLERVDPERRVAVVQIDDGYMTSHGDWLDWKPGQWPGGPLEAFREIAAAGRVPGVWVGPFMVGSGSRLAREHPDWLLRWADGTRVVEWRDYDGTKGDFEHYVLDTTHPGALAWVREVFRSLRAAGARFFKTDFLEWGSKDSTVVRRHVPGRTGLQVARDLMAAIREEIGPESHWLACISHFAPALGFADGVRVASDVGLSWNGPGGTGNDGTGGGTQNMIEEMFATQYVNRAWWENDPDVVYLRDHHVLHEDGAWQALACWHGILGGSVNTSDEVHLYPPERRAWWDFLRPGDGGVARLPYFDSGHRFRVAVREYAEGWGVLLLNDRMEPRWGRCRLVELTGNERAACFAWAPGVAEPMGELTELALELEGHRHRLVFVSRDGRPPPRSLTLGGAR